MPLSTGASAPAVAVDGRGDVVVAWTREVRDSVRVRVAVRRAGSARFAVRTLVDARRLAVRGLTVALDRRGRATVAWVDQPNTRGLLHGHKTVRAAWVTVARGRWSAVQAVGRSSPFAHAWPRLAAAADGTVALTWNAGVRAAPGVAVAFRSGRLGRRFGDVHAVPTGRSYLMDPVLLADSSGGWWLGGVRDCDRDTSRGVVYRAGVRTRRFSPGVVVAPAPARSLSVALDARGVPVFAWLTGACSTTEILAGRPMGAAWLGRRASAASPLGGPASTGLVLAGAVSGADASWYDYQGTPPGTVLQTVRIGADGTHGSAVAPEGGWAAIAADGHGDQLVRQASSPMAAIGALGARPAGSATVAPAPFSAVGFPWTAGTAGAGDGRALAALAPSSVATSTPALIAAVWRP